METDQDGWEFNGEGCWAHFMKKEIALENQFIPGVAVGEDTIWALTMLNSSKDYRMGMLYEKWYYYIQNDYSVLNKYNPKIVGQLTLPVDILEKKVWRFNRHCACRIYRLVTYEAKTYMF